MVRPKMITAGSLRSSVAAYPFPLLMAGIMLALAVAGSPARALLSFDRRAIEAGQVWRLLTGHWVHLGYYHCALNLLGLTALVVLCPAPLRFAEWTRRVMFLSLGVTLGLYMGVPDLHRYVGMSGVLHGLIVLGLVPMARRGDRIAIACLLFVLGKIAWECFAGAPLSDARSIGGRVVTEAHLFGTLCGLLYGLAFGIFNKGESPQ